MIAPSSTLLAICFALSFLIFGAADSIPDEQIYSQHLANSHSPDLPSYLLGEPNDDDLLSLLVPDVFCLASNHYYVSNHYSDHDHVSYYDYSSHDHFHGTNKGIGSWFYTNDGSGTNGHSWCGYPYADSSPVFAVSVSRMLADGGGSRAKAGPIYYGLEILVTPHPYNDGWRTTTYGPPKLLVLGDGFDDRWAHGSAAIDIAYDAFQPLFGRHTSNKDDVLMNCTWEFTGRRITQYSYENKGSTGGVIDG
ncbi:hypothetical protein RQP46_002481 [Phenoliferia psychrophenolica]